MFSSNLFSKSYINLNPNDIYYYMEAYIKYSKNKKSNYVTIFKFIQNHILSCNKKDCPGKILIPRATLYSKFTDLSVMKIDDFQNEINKNIKNNDDKMDINNVNYRYYSDNIKNNNNANNVDINKNKTQRNTKEINANILTNEMKPRKSNLRKKKSEKIGSISLFSSNSKVSLSHTFVNSNKILNMKINNNKENINEQNLNLNINNSKIEKLKDEHFKMIGEQEIINRINFLYKRKKYENLQNYIFIHLQYLLRIKQNYRLALYFVGKYSLSDIKINFLSKYYLYEIKKYICENFIHFQNLKIIKDPYIINYREENIFIKKIIDYIHLYQMIKILIKIFCEKIIFFFTFRTELHNSIALQKYLKSKIYPVIKSAEDIQNSLHKLKYLMDKNYNEEKNPIKSIELSYLISNFFKLIEGKISQDIAKYITPVLYLKEPHYEKLLNEFNHFMMNSPLIINLTKKDSFNICYFTNFFLDKLGYDYSDLKNKDFHEKLFPGGQELMKEHAIIMKEFLFFYKNNYSKEKTFLKSKEGFLISINFTSKTFPHFYDDFFLIINIIFNEESVTNISHLPFEENRKRSNINNDKVNIYSFFLDYHFEFLGLTKNFYLEYDINQNMFRELRINFCQFFCVNENKLIEKINKEKITLIKKHPIYNHKTSLRESNKAFTIFNNIKIESTFKLRDEKLLERFFFPSIVFYDRIDKKKLVHKIPEIMNLIDEIGLDYDWYIRLQNFKDRLMINGHIQNFKESGISSITNYNPHEYRRSTLLDPNLIFESNSKTYPEQFYEVVYSIRKIGSISYYIIDLHETIYNNIEETQIANVNTTNEEENNNVVVFNKRNSTANLLFNKNFKKLASQRSIKTNIFLSNNSKTLEEENKEENGISRKAKTKVFFPIFSKNTLNNNQKISENNKIEDKLNKKNIETNQNNKICQSEKIKRISKEIQQNTKSLKANYIKNHIKVNKIQKRETIEEEEENAQLIPKDKFNEVLKKLNKKNKIFIIIISIFIFLSIIIIIIKLNISLIGFKQSKTALLSVIYLEIMKFDIYSQTIFSILYCINDNNLTSLSNIHIQSKERNEKTIEHLKFFQNNFNQIFNNKIFQKIADILKEEIEMNYLSIDRTILTQNVHIIEEIRKLSYKSYGLIDNNETCNINELYGYKSEMEDNNNITIANSIQQIVFYFLNNSLSGYRYSFNKLTEEFSDSIEKMFITYQNIIFYFLICIIISLIIFLIFYIIKTCFDYNFYQLLFLYYYNFENAQLKFENQIYYLYKIVLEFNCENINYFEFIKNNSHLIYLNDDINKNFSNLNQINMRNNMRSSLKRKFNKRNSTVFKMNFNFENDKNKVVEPKNMNGSNLNGSVNGSSLQLLNNSSNNKISLKNNSGGINSKFYFGVSNEKDEKEESIDSLLKISSKILPNSIKISLIFILLGVIIYLIISCVNIIETKKEKYIWKYSVNLSINMLERIPKMMALLIYSCKTVISNNPYRINGSIFNDQPNYLKFFKANSLYYSEEIMNKYFKNNFFGQLLRDNLRINHNINNYLYQEKNNIFKITKHWENLLNSGGYFCIYASIGRIIFDEDNYTNYDFIREIETLSLKCNKENKGIDESGVKLEINYILQELTNKYIEFISYNNSNITLDQARDKFLNSEDMKRIFDDMEYPLLIYYNTIVNTIYLDFQNQTDLLVYTQILFDALQILANFMIIICLLSVITKGEKYKRLFAYFLEIPKYNYN